MKSLINYIEEKLVINKDLKRVKQSVDDTEFDWDELKFEDVDEQYRDAEPPRGIKSLYNKKNKPYQ